MISGNVPFPYLNLQTTMPGQYIRPGDDGTKSLAAYQSRRLVDEIARIPDLKRGDHSVDQQLAVVERRARYVAKLRPEIEHQGDAAEAEKLMKRLSEHAASLERLHLGLDIFRKENGNDLSRARPLRERQAQSDLFSAEGWR